MPYPQQTFPDFASLLTYMNNEWVTNGNEEIDAIIGNNVVNGLLTFIEQSPLNWQEGLIVSTGGVITASRPVVIFTTVTPTSLTWGDNIYNEFVFINMTANDIPLAGGLVYYAPTGSSLNYIPANNAVTVVKATNDLWVQSAGVNGGTAPSTQKQPKSFLVGTTTGAPTVDTSTWTLPAFANSWVVLFVGTIIADMQDLGDGSPYITKLIASDTLTITNYKFQSGDKLSYILITP